MHHTTYTAKVAASAAQQRRKRIARYGVVVVRQLRNLVRRYAGTVTYMERLSSEDCVCLRHRWDVLSMYNLLW